MKMIFELSSNSSTFWCCYLQFPSENVAPGRHPFNPVLFISVCTRPHHISSLQQADTNLPSLLISQTTFLLGLPIEFPPPPNSIFGPWLTMEMSCEWSHLCLLCYFLFHPLFHFFPSFFHALSQFLLRTPLLTKYSKGVVFHTAVIVLQSKNGFKIRHLINLSPATREVWLSTFSFVTGAPPCSCASTYY